MAGVKLFYAVRRVVDEAGRSLPAGATVQGLLYAEVRFDRNDVMGQQQTPVYLETPAGGFVNATLPAGGGAAADEPAALPGVALRAAASIDELTAAQGELMFFSSSSGGGGGGGGDGDASSAAAATMAAIALPADPLLWAMALTGKSEQDLESKKGNEGA